MTTGHASDGVITDATGAPGAVILLVEDEPQMRRFLRAALGSQGYRLIEATTGADGITQAATRNPDLVLLDLGLPDIDGLEVTRRLREWGNVPIIVVSARGREPDKVEALDAGADDYLTKPFGVPELLARIRVALRRRAREPGEDVTDEPVFEHDGLRVDLAARTVEVGGAEVHLTPTEYKLLLTLVRNAGKVLTHRQLLKEVWGPAHASQTQYLHVYMGQLRQKLEPDPTRPRHLITEPGVGYRLRAA
jgi:two-component system KDP operon response regulator KdpE